MFSYGKVNDVSDSPSFVSCRGAAGRTAIVGDAKTALGEASRLEAAVFAQALSAQARRLRCCRLQGIPHSSVCAGDSATVSTWQLPTGKTIRSFESRETKTNRVQTALLPCD
jgi:hypothetical protein